MSYIKSNVTTKEMTDECWRCLSCGCDVHLMLAWEVLVGALEEMGENRVAENIRQQYIRGSEL